MANRATSAASPFHDSGQSRYTRLAMSNLEYKPAYHRSLPHIQPPGATFFLTFRLAGSVPQSVVEGWELEAKALARMLNNAADDQAAARMKRDFQRRRFRELEKLLDGVTTGPCWLKDERVARLAMESLHYRDGQVYRLDAFCVLSNHIHAVFAPLADKSTESDDEIRYPALQKIMHSLKMRIARQSNSLLGRKGPFWQDETFDHYTRDYDEWIRVVKYTLINPVKAGLVNDWRAWPYSYCRPDLAQHVLRDLPKSRD
ncbi:MAG: hypothetical protein U0Z53_09705 [Blastocatellia bacterium]